MLISDRLILEALYASGWSDSRRVDITLWIIELEAAGFFMNRCAREVLSSLGGMVIQPVLSETQVYLPSPVAFDPLRLKWGSRPISWEQKLKTTMSPLGECFDDSSLFIDEDCRLYAAWSGILERLGGSFEDSLSTLLFAQKRGERINLPQV